MKQNYKFLNFLLILSLISCNSYKNELYKKWNTFPNADISLTFISKYKGKGGKYNLYIDDGNESTSQNTKIILNDKVLNKKGNYSPIVEIDPNFEFGKFAKIQIDNNNGSIQTKRVYIPKQIEWYSNRNQRNQRILDRNGTISWEKDTINQNPIEIQIEFSRSINSSIYSGKKPRKYKHIVTEDDGEYKLTEKDLGWIPQNARLNIKFQRYNSDTIWINNDLMTIETINNKSDFVLLIN